MTANVIDSELVLDILDGEAAAANVELYFAAHEGRSDRYTGRYFERLGGGGDRPEARHRFDSTDLVAVTMLSVNVPAEAAIAILETETDHLSELLSRVPVDLDIWDAADGDLDSDSAASKLWERLTGLHGIGWVTAGKLLARKRPRLIPVYDEVVRVALQRGTDGGYWLALRDLLSDEEIRRRLTEIKNEAESASDISLIRIFDVAVWMHGKARLKS